MINPRSLTLNARRAAAFGVLAIGALLFPASAAAAPLPLFPFFMDPAGESPRRCCGRPAEDEGGRARCRHG